MPLRGGRVIWRRGHTRPRMDCPWRSKCWSSLDTGATVRGGRRGRREGQERGGGGEGM